MSERVNFVEICYGNKILERYYLFLAKRISERFYQNNGFIVLQRPKLKTPAEVVFPKFGSLLEDVRLNKVFSLYSNMKNFPLWLDDSAYERCRFWDSAQLDFKITIKPSNEKLILNFFRKHRSVFLDFAASYGANKSTFKLKLIPVNFGTSKTFSYNASSNTMLVTWRYDLKDSLLYVIEGFVSGFVTSEKQHRDGAIKTRHGWYEREAVCDYLTIRMLYSLELREEVSMFKTTVGSLKTTHKFARLRQESDKYLAELGIPKAKDISISNIELRSRILFLGEKKLKLTGSESKFVNCLIKSYPYVATFDEIATSLWGDDEEGFSLQALARIQSNLRLKFKSLGYEYFLSTLRGEGVLLNLDSVDQ